MTLRDGVHLQVLPFASHLWSRFGGDWGALLARCGCSSAFMSSAWIRQWLEVFGERLRPEVLIWRGEDDEAVAACVVTMRDERHGPFTMRRAYLNATGEHIVASEHNVLLCVRGMEARAHADLIEHLRSHRANSLMMCGFVQQSRDAMLAAWPAHGPLHGFVSEDRFVPLAILRAAGSDYLATLSRSTRGQIRRSVRLYAEQYGPPVVEVADSAVVAEAWLSDLCVLHQRRWSARGKLGAFSSDEALQFHAGLVRVYAGKQNGASDFAIDLVRVRFGGTTVGILYNLRVRGRTSFYQSGLAYSADNKLKPGLVTHALAIQHYLDGDATEYDFLAGDPEALRYKESLASGQRPLVWEELFFPSLKVRVIETLRSVRQRVRRQSPTIGAPERAI